MLFVDLVQRFGAHLKVFGRQMRITQSHGKRAMAEKLLYPLDINAVLRQPRSAGVTQNMRHDLRVLGKAGLLLCLQPGCTEFRIADIGKRTDGTPASLTLQHA